MILVRVLKSIQMCDIDEQIMLQQDYLIVTK